jgi:hypothetical protein
VRQGYTNEINNSDQSIKVPLACFNLNIRLCLWALLPTEIRRESEQNSGAGFHVFPIKANLDGILGYIC